MIILIQKSDAAPITTPCPLCAGAIGDDYMGTPVLACTLDESGNAGAGEPAVICRACALLASPLLGTLSDLAHTAAVARPGTNGHVQAVLDAVEPYRERALDAAKVMCLAFSIENKVLPEQQEN